jgi:hypothetical protein
MGSANSLSLPSPNQQRPKVRRRLSYNSECFQKAFFCLAASVEFDYPTLVYKIERNLYSETVSACQ